LKLYSYVVARDYGFAPNPFYGVCTLATCKPLIRKAAQVGDWIVGTGSKRYGLEGCVVFVMKISKTLTYDEYWRAKRFRSKRPNLKGSIKQAFGDNIYHRHPRTRRWIQEDSHHSLPGGRMNRANIRHDTQAPRVLIGFEFSYWGAAGPQIPERLIDVRGKRGHKCNFSEEFVESFTEWIESQGIQGYVSAPKEFGA
jgi:hypothetical protein